MPESCFLFIKFYSFCLFSLLFFFGLGHFLLKPASRLFQAKGFYATVFINTLAGLCACVLFYSIIVARFKTIHLAFVLVIGFLLLEAILYTRKHRNPVSLLPYEPSSPLSLPELAKKILPLLLLSLLVYTWFAVLILNFHGGFGYILNGNPAADYYDKIYYSNISQMLSLTGQENRCVTQNLLNSVYHGTEPYHYFELWLNALFSTQFKSLNFVSLYLLTYPVTNFLILLGLFALAEMITRVSIPVLFTTGLFVFVGGLYFGNIFIQSPYLVSFGESTLEFGGEKYAIPLLLGICCFLFYARGYTLLGLTVLLLIPVVSVGTLPGLAGGLALFLLLSFLFRKLSLPEFLRIGAYLLSLILFILFFYRRYGINLHTPYLKQNAFYYSDLDGFSFRSVKIYAIELAYRIYDIPFRSLILYLPFILMSALAVFRNKTGFHVKGLLFLILSVYFCSLLSFGTFYKFFDSFQFFTNNLILLNLFLILGLLLFFFGRDAGSDSAHDKSSRNMKTGLLICTLLVLSTKGYHSFGAYKDYIPEQGPYSDKYLTDIAKLNLDKKEKYLVGSVSVEDKYDLDKTGFSCPYLVYMPQYYPCVSLSGFENNEWNSLEPVAEFQKNALELSAFSQFIMKQKKEGTFENMEQSQADFVRYYHFSFLIIQKNAKLNSPLSSLIRSCITDSLSGERFVTLK